MATSEFDKQLGYEDLEDFGTFDFQGYSGLSWFLLGLGRITQFYFNWHFAYTLLLVFVILKL